jgi:hypothetical protein
MPTIRFESTLVEEVVTAEISRRRKRGDFRWVTAYRHLADPIYETTPPDQRDAQFEQVHAQLFAELGFGQWFDSTFAELPDLQRRAPALLVLAARLAQEEGAVIGRDRQSVCLRVLPARFAEPELLAAFVRHELLHAADMLDDSFGYRMEYAGDDHQSRVWTIGAANLRADRYHALWCAHVDARLIRQGLTPLAGREAHRRDFDARFAAVPAALRTELFERVWNAEQLTHTDIMDIAHRSDALAVGRHPHPAQIPGAPCPLCRFPTHRWARQIGPPIARLIRGDFPTWQLEAGACERCVEAYTLRTCLEVSR